MDPGRVGEVIGARARSARPGVHHEPGGSGLSRVVNIALYGRRRGARNGDPQERSILPVPQGCERRSSSESLMAGSIRAILGSSLIALVWRLVSCRDAKYSDEESGGMEQDDLHPHLRRKRWILRSRSTVCGAGTR